jgi:enamine deaminase RidA (YjgF/YER057c/UK114 family)
MVYISSMGPIDRETGQIVAGGIKPQTSQCLRNIQANLEGQGSSLDKIVWASWSLREPAEFDEFNEEWVHWFPGDSPVGQQSLMPPLQRRAGFRISIGVIAEASGGGNETPPGIGPSTSVVSATTTTPATPTARAAMATPQIEPPGSPAPLSMVPAGKPARPENPGKPVR